MPEPVTRRRVLRVGAIVALVVAAVAVGVYSLLLSDLRRTLEWRLGKLRAAGCPTSWAEAAPPPIAEEDNAAVLYERAYDQLTLPYPDAHTLRHFALNDPPRSRERLRTDIERILERNRECIGMIRQAAARPGFRLRGYWEQPPRELKLDELRSVVTCAQVMVADAVNAAERGDTRRAVESCRALLRISAHLASARTMETLLLSNEVMSLASDALSQVLDSGQLDPESCRTLFDELQAMQIEALFRDTMAADANVTLRLFEWSERKPHAMRGLLVRAAGARDSKAGRALLALYTEPIWKPLRLKEEVSGVEMIERTLAITAKPYRETSHQAMATYRELERIPVHYLILHTSMPYPLAGLFRDWALAHGGLMQVALALEAYRARRGAYPQTLDALREYPGWELPNDPFSGKPFVYERRGAGFLLCSWGQDLDDDAGRPVQWRWQRAGSIPFGMDDGDFVWGSWK